jgi:LysM repeat protein
MTHRLQGVATPALVGMAAAFAVANTPATGHAAAQAPARHSPAAAAGQSGVNAASLLSVTGPAPRRHSALPAKYTVRPGDTLSAIAKRFYRSPDFWPALYWANHSRIRYANQIEAGQVLTVPVKPRAIPSPPSVLGPAPAPAPVTATAPAAAHYGTSAAASSAHAASTYTGSSGSYQACVIARESGGNSQVMNSSGHYGLYQFSSSTWAAYGGNPANFGNASVAEQNQVFNNAIAAGGQSNWSPYDGC